MRKYLAIFLAALLLSGCAGGTPEQETAVPEIAAPEITGCMWAYFLNQGDVLLERNGDWLLIHTGGEPDLPALEKELNGAELAAVLTREEGAVNARQTHLAAAGQEISLAEVRLQVLAAEEDLLAVRVAFQGQEILILEAEDPAALDALGEAELSAKVLASSGTLPGVMLQRVAPEYWMVSGEDGDLEALEAGTGAQRMTLQETGTVQAAFDGKRIQFSWSLNASSEACG